MFAILEFGDFACIAGIVAVFASGASVYLQPRESTRLARLEGKVDLLLKHAGIAPIVEVAPEVLKALERGDKIQAIKLQRDATGMGLKEAKDFVEGIESKGGY
jgi:ribosomal protein L7/L12